MEKTGRVNSKVKIFCYVCFNVGVALWSGLVCLESTSIRRGLFIFFGSLVFINLLLWIGFKARDSGRLTD